MVGDAAQLILAFGSHDLVADPDVFAQIKAMYPKASIVLCSTAGEIVGSEVNDNSISLVALKFSSTAIRTAVVETGNENDCRKSGIDIANALIEDDLVYVLVISDGLLTNGSELALGLSSVLPERVVVTGGLAGDNGSLQGTVIGIDELPRKGLVAAVGFYGSSLLVNSSFTGAGTPFGPIRRITKAESNVLYELDGHSALSVFRKYLGKYANELPGAALYFPLSVRQPETGNATVRTVVSVNEDEGSLTFAGDIPLGAQACLTLVSVQSLIEGVEEAASDIYLKNESPELAILVSCAARKYTLGQQVDEEPIAVQNAFNRGLIIVGFYSYGEFSPASGRGTCLLQNHTLTITTFSELE